MYILFNLILAVAREVYFGFQSYPTTYQTHKSNQFWSIKSVEKEACSLLETCWGWGALMREPSTVHPIGFVSPEKFPLKSYNLLGCWEVSSFVKMGVVARTLKSLV